MGNIDSIPVFSQLKSFVQLISGDLEGAKKTQENFRDMAPVVSQITSLVHAAKGDHEAARNVQKKFVKGLEASVDGLPVVGHIKGGIHYALGDDSKGDEVMKSASKPLLTIPAGVGGFLAGGPAGGAAAAIAAGQAYDGIVTGIDTAVNGEENGSPRYYGSWNTFDRIGKGEALAGEIFDASAGIALDGISGAVGMKVGSGVKGYFKTVGREFADTVPGSQILKKNLKGKITRHKGRKKQDTYTERIPKKYLIEKRMHHKGKKKKDTYTERIQKTNLKDGKITRHKGRKKQDTYTEQIQKSNLKDGKRTHYKGKKKKDTYTEQIQKSNLKDGKRTHYKGKKKQNAYIEQEADFRYKGRCRRDAEFHLTAAESSFVKEHLTLDGGVGNIMSADWRNMTVPDTVSTLVSLFVVLKLILWDDKNGRKYSRELCSYTSHSENEIDNCQFELLVNLRLLENQMQYDTDENLFKFILDPEIPSAMGNSSRFMVKVVTELFGILSSMGDYRQIGILWAEELCIYKQPGEYVSCENELIQRLHITSIKIHHLSEMRQRRARQTCTIRKKPDVGAIDGENIPRLSNIDPTKIRSNMVGPYGKIKYAHKKYTRDHGIGQNTVKLEANHIPPQSVLKKWGLKPNEIIAHYIPKDIHQVGMTYVGTSKNSRVSIALRRHQNSLIGQKKLDQAIALDIVGSYGRANAKLATSKNPNTFRPALVEYRNDLHAVVNSYVSNDFNKIGRSKISKRQADKLHNLIENEIKFYDNNKHMSVDSWFREVEGKYKQILNQNGLKSLYGDEVTDVNRGYGR